VVAEAIAVEIAVVEIKEDTSYILL
jgi:hypothetical protein